MASLKELRVRINSVKSTKKITQVMKMIAAAKLKKAQKRAIDARPCAIESKKMINQVISTMPYDELPELLKGRGLDKIHLLFVVASDKGLCGGFNFSIIKLVKQYIQKILAKGGCQVKIICIGGKAAKLLKSSYGDYIIQSIEKMHVNYDEVSRLIGDVIANNEFDIVKVFYTKFENSMLQVPTQEQIVPFEVDEVISCEYQYESDQHHILQFLALNNLAVQLYKAMVESQASEYMLRMVAMDNATRNASDMIDRLSLYYNRSRQAAITKELIEIVSGAEVL